MRWAVAVTTAPRKVPTLEKCIESIRTAGFEPVVFAEPDSPVPSSGIEVFTNDIRLGVWHNWLKASRWCLDQDADVVLTVQDDSIFHPESRMFVESILWPHPKTGYLSLYCPKHYQQWRDGRQREFGVYPVDTKSAWGATALAFHPEILKRTIESSKARTWKGARTTGSLKKWETIKQRRIDNPHLIQNSDTIIGAIVRRQLHRKLMYISPSLVDHCSEHSSIGHGGNKGRRNAYYIADHSLPLSHQIPTDRIRVGDISL